jgi:hypothetical protein
MHFGKKCAIGEPLHEVEIRDVRTAEREQVSEAFCYKSIPALLDFGEESGAVFQASTVFVYAEVRRGIEELSDQVKIIGRYVDAVEAGH